MNMVKFELWCKRLKKEGYDIDHMPILDIIKLIKTKEANNE